MMSWFSPSLTLFFYEWESVGLSLPYSKKVTLQTPGGSCWYFCMDFYLVTSFLPLFKNVTDYSDSGGFGFFIKFSAHGDVKQPLCVSDRGQISPLKPFIFSVSAQVLVSLHQRRQTRL